MSAGALCWVMGSRARLQDSTASQYTIALGMAHAKRGPMPTNMLCRPSCFTMDRAVRMNSAALVSTPLLERVAVSSSRVLMQSAGMEQTTAQAPAHAPAQYPYC